MKGVYIVGGYPDKNRFEDIIEKLNKVEFDFIEIGLPFNDPVADGDIIAKAIYETVEKKYSVDDILKIALKTDKDLYIMTYSNVIYGYGLENFSLKYKDLIKGLILADVPNRLHNFFYKKGLKIPIIPFVTPETRDEDLEKINKLRGDFVYFVGIRGTTGGKIDFTAFNESFLKKLKENLKKKIVFGFGIKNINDCKQVLNFSDGFVVGTEIVKRQKNTEQMLNFVKKIMR